MLMRARVCVYAAVVFHNVISIHFCAAYSYSRSLVCQSIELLCVCVPVYSVKNKHHHNVTFQLTDNTQKQRARTLTHIKPAYKSLPHHKHNTLLMKYL